MVRALIVAAVVAGAMACGCGGSGRRGFLVHPSYRPQALTLPRGAGDDLAACVGAVALIPAGGGIAAAGWNGFVVDPQATPLTGVACDEAQNLYAVDDDEVASFAAGERSHVADLPRGDWRILSSVDGNLWVWGKIAGGAWQVGPVLDGRLVPSLSGKHRIHAVAVVGNVGVVAAIGRVVIAIPAEGKPAAIAKVDTDVDGLAVAPDGDLLVSSSRGIERIAQAGAGAIMLARDLHGPLRTRPDTIYVLSREQGAVIRLSPLRQSPAY